MQVSNMRTPVCDMVVLRLSVRNVFRDLTGVMLKIVLVTLVRENDVAKCPLTL